MYITKEILMEEKKYHKGLIERFENELLGLPGGTLSKKCIKGNDYIYHQTYKTVQGKGRIDKDSNRAGRRKIVSKYLSKEELPLMEAITRRRFINKSLPVLKKNLKLIEKMAAGYAHCKPEAILEKMSPMYEGICMREFLIPDQLCKTMYNK